MITRYITIINSITVNKEAVFELKKDILLLFYSDRSNNGPC